MQSRPITTLPVEPVEWVSPIPGAKWMNGIQVGEWVKEPPSPLATTTTLPTMLAARERARVWPPVPKHYPPASSLINGWWYQRADHKPLGMLIFMGGMGLLLRPPNGHKRAQRRWPTHLDTLTALEHTDLGTLSDLALHDHTDRLLCELGWWWLEFSLFNGLGRTGIAAFGDMKLPGLPNPTDLYAGNDNLALDAERALHRAAADSSKVEDFLTRFGHTVETADPIDPTLRESPAHVD